jgi:hypothetical protein
LLRGGAVLLKEKKKDERELSTEGAGQGATEIKSRFITKKNPPGSSRLASRESHGIFKTLTALPFD